MTDEFLTVAALKERGWTDGKIRTVLGEPDRKVVNMHYRSAAPLRLYALKRVTAAEQSPEWQEWLQKTLARRQKQSETFKAIAAAKREALIAATLQNLEFWPPQVTTKRQLTRMALDHYRHQKEAFNNERGFFDDPVTVPSPSDPEFHQFRERVTLNMLRHEFSSYDALCNGLAGEIGRTEAYDALRPHIDGMAASWIQSLH